MRIRGYSISPPPFSFSSNSSTSGSNLSALSSDSSSSNSLTSSSSSLPSSSSSHSSSSSSGDANDYKTRCEGLDLLAEAAFHLSGSLLCVPFTQRRVIRRRKRALRFCEFTATEGFDRKDEGKEAGKSVEEDEGIRVVLNTIKKRRTREMALPSKYRDSVRQPLKRRTRGRNAAAAADIDGMIFGNFNLIELKQKQKKRVENVVESPLKLALPSSARSPSSSVLPQKRKVLEKRHDVVILKKKSTTGIDNASSHSKGFNYIVSPEKFYSARVGFHINLGAIDILKSKLSELQLQKFRETCFGHFLDMPSTVWQAQLVHNILLREVVQPIESELWIKFNEVTLKFSVDDFGLITGLKCKGDTRRLTVGPQGIAFKEKYFNGIQKINKQSVYEAFVSRCWQNDDDAVKFAILFFVHHFLFSHKSNKLVNDVDFELVESGEFNDYPWGKDLFEYTLDSLKGNFCMNEKREDAGRAKYPVMYRLIGFPLALQVWFYECCSFANGRYAICREQKCPRILRWSATGQPTFKQVDKDFNSLPQTKLKNLVPTDEEMLKPYMDGLFVNEKSMNFLNQELDNHPPDDHEDFCGPSSTKVASLPSSSKISSTQPDRGGQSLILEEIKKLSKMQRELNREVASLSVKVETNFSKILQEISVMSEKLATAQNL